MSTTERSADDRYQFTKPPLSVVELEQMLKDVRAPKPHAGTDGILGAYVVLLRPNPTHMTARELPAQVVPIVAREAGERAKPALKVLKRELATIVAIRETVSNLDPDIRALKRLRDAVNDLDPDILTGIAGHSKRPYVWHAAASTFWMVYREITADMGLSEDGPSARFLQVALERLGYGSHERPAILKSLRRSKS